MNFGRRPAVTVSAFIGIVTVVGLGAPPAWRLYRPSNTGIPGEEVRFVRFAPDGRLWVGARWPFWQEGGLGVYDLDAQVWTTYANWETPIPSEYVNDIAFEPGGVAWIATDGGLVRFDGINWTVYTTANAPFLHNVISEVELDSQGRVWVNNTNPQDQNAALFRFDGTTWQSWAVPQLPWSDPWRQLIGLHVDANDHVWIANMTLNGVAEYDGTTWTPRFSSVNTFSEITHDLAGNIWLIAGGLGYDFYKWNGTTLTHYDSQNTPFGSTTVTTFGVASDGAVYVGNWMGQVIRTINAGQSWTLFLSGLNTVYGIASSPATGHIWIGTLGAVGDFAADGTWVRDYNTYDTGLPDFWIDNMYTDRDGYFWVASGEGGLSRFDGVRWRNWGAHNAGSEPYPFVGNEPMFGIYEDTAGTHWIGGNGVARWDSATGEFTGFWNWENTPGFGVDLWYYFAQDMSGLLFTATQYGTVYRFNGTTWIQDTGVQPYAVLGLPGMQADSQGNVWIAAWFDLYRWDGSAWSQVTLPDPNYFFDLGGINGLAIGPDDTLWFGTAGGLVHWDGTTFTLYDTTNSPLPLNSVGGVAVRADGLIAASTSQVNDWPYSGGLVVIDGDPNQAANWSVYMYGQTPLPHYQLGRVAFDAQGDLWVSALSEGVAVLLIGQSPLTGDLNCDGVIGFGDINPFVLALTDPAGYSAAFPNCDLNAADINGDGTVDFGDINPFVALLSDGG